MKGKVLLILLIGYAVMLNVYAETTETTEDLLSFFSRVFKLEDIEIVGSSDQSRICAHYVIVEPPVLNNYFIGDLNVNEYLLNCPQDMPMFYGYVGCKVMVCNKDLSSLFGPYNENYNVPYYVYDILSNVFVHTIKDYDSIKGRIISSSLLNKYVDECLNSVCYDADEDGLKDYEELYIYKTLPFQSDTDGDFISDIDEIKGFRVICDVANDYLNCVFDTHLKDKIPMTLSAYGVFSKDIPQHFEIEFKNLDPSAYDTDGDGLSDLEDVVYAITGYVLNGEGYDIISDSPLSKDTDNDELLDSSEIMYLKDNPLSSELSCNKYVPYTTYEINANYEVIRTDSFVIYGGVSEDFDKDGLKDMEELDSNTLWVCNDTDNDGLSDGYEHSLNLNPLTPDTDNDGLTDSYEIQLGTDPLQADTDNDGLSDGEEVFGVRVFYLLPLRSANDCGVCKDYETINVSYSLLMSYAYPDPLNADTDGDGIKDGEDPASNSTQDSDYDGLKDSEDPCPLNVDCDYDGLKDGDELNIGTDPLNPDSDCDKISDFCEVKFSKTDPLRTDTDGDGFMDGDELYGRHSLCYSWGKSYPLNSDMYPPPTTIYPQDPFLVVREYNKVVEEKVVACGSKEENVEIYAGGSIVVTSNSSHVRIDQNNLYYVSPTFDDDIVIDLQQSYYAVWINDDKYECSVSSISPGTMQYFDVIREGDTYFILRPIQHKLTSYSFFDTLPVSVYFSCEDGNTHYLRDTLYIFGKRNSAPVISFEEVKWDDELNVGIARVSCDMCNYLKLSVPGAYVTGKEQTLNYVGKISKTFRVVPVKRFCDNGYDVGTIYHKIEDQIEVAKVGKEVGVELAKSAESKTWVGRIGYGAIALVKSVKTAFGGVDVFIPSNDEDDTEKESNLKDAIKSQILEKGIDAFLEFAEKGIDYYEVKERTKDEMFTLIAKACNDNGCDVKRYQITGKICE